MSQCFVCCRYSLHLYDENRQSGWESRDEVIYHCDLAFDLVTLVTDFLHHVHMLVSESQSQTHVIASVTMLHA